MPRVAGLHHVALPAADVLATSDWYTQTFGFVCVLVEEEESRVVSVVLEHPTGVLLYLHQAADRLDALSGFSVLGLTVDDRKQLLRWADHLTRRNIRHTEPRAAHLGWTLDVIDPNGLHVQLHTRELVSADDI
jgi:catechol 2,3-dioxygenase-like lactoylglutathione lyase family enzyme